MCVVAIAWKAHVRWELIVAGNRDEFHARPSAPLSRWNDADVIAGRDLVSAGSWMGVSAAGRFAVVTNIRSADGPDLNKRSRGALVADWLRDGKLPDAVSAFNPFNLIVTDPESAMLVSNRSETAIALLPVGIHGLSNGIPDEHWPRKDRLVASLSGWLAGPAKAARELLDLLVDAAKPDRDAHPLFIRSPGYGTRCSTVITVNTQGQGMIMERRFGAGGLAIGETCIDFAWDI